MAELASLPRAAVVVEDRYSAIFKLDRVPPAVIADGLAELQVRWPTVPIVCCETRPLAEEWTYRYLAAAHTWATTEPTAAERIGVAPGELDEAPTAPEPSTAEVRAPRLRSYTPGTPQPHHHQRKHQRKHQTQS